MPSDRWRPAGGKDYVDLLKSKGVSVDNIGANSSEGPDLEGVEVKRKVYYAWCLWNGCPAYNNGKKARHREVPKTTIFCPYCEYALVWRTYRHVVGKRGRFKGQKKKDEWEE